MRVKENKGTWAAVILAAGVLCLAMPATAKDRGAPLAGKSVTVELEEGGAGNKVEFLLSLPPDARSVSASGDNGSHRVRVSRTAAADDTVTLTVDVRTQGTRKNKHRSAEMELTGVVAIGNRVLLGKVDLGAGEYVKVWVTVSP